MKHSIVVPACNEQAALPTTIERLQALADNFELLVVDDGSTDATAEIAARLAQSSRSNRFRTSKMRQLRPQTL